MEARVGMSVTASGIMPCDLAHARRLIDGKAVADVKRIGIARENALRSMPVGEGSQRKSECSPARKGDFAVFPMAAGEWLQHRKGFSPQRGSTFALRRVFFPTAPLRNIAPRAVLI